jgi:hypothetical protein
MATVILNGATATGAGATFTIRSSTQQYVYKSFQAVGVMSAGTGTVAVNIEVSNNGTEFLTLATISLSLSTSKASDGFACVNTWNYVRANVTAITTNGSVTVWMEP